MDLDALENIGLTPNEAKTYVALCVAGRITAGKLARRVDIHRSRTYEALDKLVRKGLAHFIILNKVHHYEALPPEHLLDLVAEQKEHLERLLPKLTSLQADAEVKQRVNAFQGVGGIKTLLRQTLDTAAYVVFGAPDKSIGIMGESFWKNYNLKLADRNIATRMIFDSSLRGAWSQGIQQLNPKTELRFLSKHFDNLTETFVFDDKVIIITWSAIPLGVLLTDPSVAKSYAQFFELLWNQSER